MSEATGVPFRVFDIEIAKTIEETPGGWEGARKGLSGLGCAVIWDSETESSILYGPEDVEALGEALEGPHVIVTFNGENFDIPAMEGMLKRKLNIRTHLDILACILASTGKRISLDNLASKTLGVGKSGNGAMAPILYQTALREGGLKGVTSLIQLLNYCSKDVNITRDVLRFWQKNGFLVGLNGPIHPTAPPYLERMGLRS